jgi:hypothetical protein
MDEHDEDVIDMVQLIVTYGDTPENRRRLARFVGNEIRTEREACAEIAEHHKVRVNAKGFDEHGSQCLNNNCHKAIAHAIRKRLGD